MTYERYNIGDRVTLKDSEDTFIIIDNQNADGMRYGYYNIRNERTNHKMSVKERLVKRLLETTTYSLKEETK